MMTHRYAWANNEKRKTLKGRKCKILVRGKMQTILVQFENGQCETVSLRALRRIKD